VDFYVYEQLVKFFLIDEELATSHPKLAEFRANFLELENIAAYEAKASQLNALPGSAPWSQNQVAQGKRH
jgi:hypothetical protein